jgi:hypothetical protein
MTIPRLLIPLLVVAAILSGYALRTSFTQPTTDIELSGASKDRVECVVTGLKCKGTANFFTRLYQDVPGIARITTYATEHRAVFRYDPAVISPDDIRAVMEKPIPLRDGSSRQVFVCQTMK